MGTMSYKRVVAKDVADALGVSLCTVNKALSGKPGISEARRRQVQEKAREMGYKADRVAQVLARNPITIGVLSGFSKETLTASYSCSIVAGMEEEFGNLEKYKIRSSFHFTGNSVDVDEVMAWIEREKVEAVCLCSTVVFLPGQDAVVERLAKLGIPLFVEGGTVQNRDRFVSMVEVDGDLSGRMAADFFCCMRGKDVRAMVMLGSMSVPNLHNKAVGFMEALAENGVSFQTVIAESYKKDEKIRQYVREAVEKQKVNCIYDASSFYEMICDELEKNGWQDRVAVIGTDYKAGATERLFASGILKAVILQNPHRIGKRVVRSAYDYLVNSRTFGMEDWQPLKTECVSPIFSTRSCFARVQK